MGREGMPDALGWFAALCFPRQWLQQIWQRERGVFPWAYRHVQTSQAQSELWYIQQQAASNFTLPSPEEIQEEFRQHNIPLGADKDVVGIAIVFGEQQKEQKQYDYARYFYGIAYELTGMDELKKILDEMPQE